MRSFREDRQGLNQAQATLRYSLRDPSLEQMDEAQARELLGEMIRVQEAELELYRREQQSLLTVLSPNQLVRFYRIRDEWGQRLQRLRQGGGPGGPPGRGGGAGAAGRGPIRGGVF
jgi:hypothetical protein